MIPYSVNRSRGIRLDANESSKNLPDWLIEEIAQELPLVEFNRYPDDQYEQLRARYGEIHDLPKESVLVGTGSDQMLMLLISRFVGPGDTLATISPDFGMYGFYDSLFHGKLDAFAIDMKKGIDLDAWIEHLKQIQPSLVVFSNPHNPSGTMLSSEQINRLAKSIAPTPLCVDEAYMEFDGDSSIDLIAQNPNLYITRTLSKAFRLAGVRVGFLLSSTQNIEDLLPYKIVYNLSSLSNVAALVALRHYGWFMGKNANLVLQRDAFMDFLKSCEHLDPIESHANFICIQSDWIEDLKKAFERFDIVVRVFEGQDYLRLTIGDPAEMRQVKRALMYFENQLEKEHETSLDPS